MPTTWVDFKELRSRVRITDILTSYKIELKIKGDRASGFCPLPAHNGQRRSPSFSVHLQKNIWKCFGCQRGGNVIDLVAYMEGLDPSNHADVRKAALMMSERFGITATEKRAKERIEQDLPTTKPLDSTPATPILAKKVLINAPLDFELKHLDPAHPYLLSRGYTPKTISTFGLGYCSRGLLAGRIAIPLNDATGKLIGYGGRVVDDSKIDQDNPKYRFPGERVRNDVKYEFHKSLFLYNGFRVGANLSDLIICEGFASVWWLHQNGYQNIVALMGASCSTEQAKLITQIVKPDGRVWLFSDGDAAGVRCAEITLPLLTPHRWTRWIKLANGRQPTDYTPDELATFFAPV